MSAGTVGLWVSACSSALAPVKVRSVPVTPIRATSAFLIHWLAVEEGQRERRVPGEPWHRQHPAGVGDADADRVDGEGDQRRHQRFEVGRMVRVEREDLRAAAGLLDRGDDLDDVVDPDPALVEGHQHAADGVVDRGPLDTVEALQLAAQRPLHRRATLDRGSGELQVRTTAGDPHAAAAPGRRAARTSPCPASVSRSRLPSVASSTPVTSAPAARAPAFANTVAVYAADSATEPAVARAWRTGGATREPARDAVPAARPMPVAVACRAVPAARRASRAGPGNPTRRVLPGSSGPCRSDLTP